ncbi:MAG: CoB--CoM heterodisulfide reductase iron-sulfur subunit B family protein [candidate division WOR-3 bacterium]|jgi:heterodisulfide reductase subunit B
MKYPYYPGCTLYSKARNLDQCARKAALRAGFELEEMPSWNCCGAIYNTNTDDLAAQVGPVRNLAKASQLGERLVTLCAACYNVLKRASEHLQATGFEADRQRLLDFVDEPLIRDVEVVHYLQVLKELGWEGLRAKVAKPLNGLKIASYYGCLMVRPKEVLKFDDPENPMVMDELVAALGGTPVRFDFKSECCGGYLVVNHQAVADACSLRVVENARTWGAELVVTTCPLCQYNLEMAQRRRSSGNQLVPVLYFTQVLGLALGLAEAELGFDDNRLDPRPFLLTRGLL